MITGGQLRAGRAYAKISAVKLAELADVGRSTIVKAESTDGIPPITANNLSLIQRTLESLGVIFGVNGEVNYKPPLEKEG
ncbi:hypothetical protein Aam_392_001 [Acidocella aminolytica 101 = DSM 11237]|uniref:HTH cro/C1-type domain-containing protein n=2 Tax=Acidocella TaxID=50709 RepID=A0A0D6PNE1_9PROT|nr:hypothetical protein Aam_392_001 [Acidocella aminolytica 101 = DSM 11237]